MREESRYQKAYFVIGIITIVTYIYYYLRMRPFWLDECFLALATMDSSYLDLFKPLTWSQVAPPIYLVICQLIYKLNIMPIELSYRLYSLIAGIGSVIIFVPFAKKFIKDNKLILISYLLYCSNFWIAYYTQEYKQYSSDIFLGMGSYLLCEKWLKLEKSKVRLWIEGSILGFISFISQTSLFIIIAYLGTLFFKEVLQVKPKIKINIKKLGHLMITGIGFALPVIVMMSILYVGNPNHQLMHDWWIKMHGFIQFDFGFLINYCEENLEYLFVLPIARYLIFILCPIFIYQLFCFYKNKQQLFLSLLFCGVLMASFLSIYPVVKRLLLWLYPFMTMVVMMFLENRKKVIGKACQWMFIFLIFTNYIILMSNLFKDQIIDYGLEEREVGPAVLILKQNPDITPVHIKKYLGIKGVQNTPDHSGTYVFYKKIYEYQPIKEMIFEYEDVPNSDLNNQKLRLRVQKQCHDFFQNKFQVGQKYGLIAMKDKLSVGCQDYFLGLGGHMEGPVYVWIHPEK